MTYITSVLVTLQFQSVKHFLITSQAKYYSNPIACRDFAEARVVVQNAMLQKGNFSFQNFLSKLNILRGLGKVFPVFLLKSG